MNTGAFQITHNGKTYDYRTPAILDIKDVAEFFKGLGYTILNLKQVSRHVVGELYKNNEEFFLKLSTTPGISIVTQREAAWNEVFNATAPRDTTRFRVPQNKETGYYLGDLFYIITDMFRGKFFADSPNKGQDLSLLSSHLSDQIDFALFIMNLQVKESAVQKISEPGSHTEYFLKKTDAWFDAVPEKVREENDLQKLLDIVRNGAHTLKPSLRHGDFTPWHTILLDNGEIGLIDGEHAMVNGIEIYDLVYLMERIYHVLDRPDIAYELVRKLHDAKIDMKKLQTVACARAIGGFLDTSLHPKPDYTAIRKFMEYCIHLT